MPDSGHIELERSVNSIVVGVRHRNDLGDLTPLVASIQRLGLLQPITIAPDGTLLCGRRRLEAIRLLKWQTVRVWVRSGLSDQLHSLLAQQDDNLLHKPLSVIEAAALYLELKAVLAEDAERRQHASRFGAHLGEEADGGGESPPPSPPGKTRDQAAQMVTSSAGYKRLEQVNGIEEIAADQDQPEVVRGFANAALSSIRAGAPVNPWFQEVTGLRRSGVSAAGDELERLAREAFARIQAPVKQPPPVVRPRKRSMRAFVHTWTDMDGWSTRHDPGEVGPALSDSEWALFERVLQETNTFHALALDARRARQPAAVG